VTDPLPIASFKLQLAERRARIVPAVDASGCPFAGPGVDLVGEEAAEAFALAAPVLAWLEAREPVRVRSLSLDIRRRRLLVTVEAGRGERPRVVKVDPGVDAASSDQIVALAAPLLRRLGEIAAVKLAARADGQH